MHKLEYRGRENLAKSFISNDIVEAAMKSDLERIKAFLDSGGDVNARSVFQSNLLHVAARTGNTELLHLLIDRGADVNALDYGGMRRTALHWACQEGHLRAVELLVAAGADTQAKGKSWSQLVQGQRCGRMIDTQMPPDMPPAALCRSLAVRLALEQPPWSRELHSSFPQRFKDVVKALLLASTAPRCHAAAQKAGKSLTGSPDELSLEVRSDPSTSGTAEEAKNSTESSGLTSIASLQQPQQSCSGIGGQRAASLDQGLHTDAAIQSSLAGGTSGAVAGDGGAIESGNMALPPQTVASGGDLRPPAAASSGSKLPLAVASGGSCLPPAVASCGEAAEATSPKYGTKAGLRLMSSWPLGWDCTLEVIARMAYPVSSWVGEDAPSTQHITPSHGLVTRRL